MNQPPTLADESQLLNELRSPEGKNWAFNQLIWLYQERLYHHIRKLVINHNDTDDLLQETFIKVFHNIDSFEGKSSLFTWLYRIATNEALGFLRKKKRRFIFFQHDYSKELAQLASQELSPTADAVEDKLQQALLQLPDKQRLVFNMRYYDALTYEQMAEITDTTVGALKASYHHATKKIEAFIQAG